MESRNNEETNRTYDSAVNFFNGFLPGYPIESVINNQQEYSRWLFNQGDDLLKAECGGPSQRVVEGLFGENATELSWHERDHILKLSEEIGCCQPVVCYPNTPNPPADCDNLLRQPTQWVGRFYQYYEGPFFSAAQISEYIQLLYLNNMTYGDVVPTFNQYQIARMVELHHDNLDITENMIATRHFGSNLLAHFRSTRSNRAVASPFITVGRLPCGRFVGYAYEYQGIQPANKRAGDSAYELQARRELK
eukprot:g1104.t1